MKHQKPINESSWIDTIAFDGGTLEIKCRNGRTMQYRSGGPELPMTKELYERFLSSDSPGKFFNAHVKKIYPGGTVDIPSGTTD